MTDTIHLPEIDATYDRDLAIRAAMNYLVLTERRGQPIQRLQLLAFSREAAALAALELVPAATGCRVLLEGEW